MVGVLYLRNFVEEIFIFLDRASEQRGALTNATVLEPSKGSIFCEFETRNYDYFEREQAKGLIRERCVIRFFDEFQSYSSIRQIGKTKH